LPGDSSSEHRILRQRAPVSASLPGRGVVVSRPDSRRSEGKAKGRRSSPGPGCGLHERAAFVDTAPRFAGCVNDEFVFAIAVSAEIGLRMPARNSRLDAAPAVGSTPSGTLAADDAIIVGKEKRLVRSMQARQRVTDVRIPRSTNANRA
jgi:hypothetical protein